MTGLIIIAILVLLSIVLVQIGRVSELATKIRGEEETGYKSNKVQGQWMLVFLFAFLAFCIISAWYFKNWMLGYGPHESASEHGKQIDNLFNVTLFFTGIVFVITHIFLFYFSWKYYGNKNRRASFIAHNNKLEIVWSVIPAFVMTFLVVKGLVAWNEIMADVGPDEDVIEIEATGYQFAWQIRYPGPDGVLGERNYRLISGINPLGQDWNDVKNLDDLHPSDIVLPVNKKVRVRITSRDVLHNFYLPHFRVKMDAVPGMPTYFIFTPTKTTEEYREELSNYPEYNLPKDPDDPQSPLLWEAFNYELACAELCGASHFSMRKIVRIVTEAEYENWLAQQPSYYLTSIRNSGEDPHRGKLLDVEIRLRREDFNTAFESALAAATAEEKSVPLNDVQFENGTAQMTDDAQFAINDIADILRRYPDVRIEIGGHTDDTGDAAANMQLSRERAQAVYQELITRGVDAARMTATGYGQTRPVASNDTEEGRRQNRRMEIQITAQ